MSKCTFTIVIDGKERVFSSDFELDSFLKSNYSNKKISKLDKTFSSTPQAATLNKLSFAKLQYDKSAVEISRINDDGDYETYIKVPNSISVTRAITEFGNPVDLSRHIVTPFNIKVWRKNRIEEWINSGLSKKEAENLVSTEELSWKKLTGYGTDVHNLAQSIIEGSDSAFKPMFLTSQQKEVFSQSFKQFINSLRAKFGSNAKFFPEFAVRSKELNSLYRKGGRFLIDNDGKRIVDTNPINSINGRIDLLVIDENGEAHLYDFKVSRKEVGDWSITDNRINKENNTWHSSKKLSTSYQLTFYRRILEQYGIKVADINVVPIYLDLSYEDSSQLNIDKLEYIEFDESKIVTNLDKTNPGGQIYENVKTILPIGVAKDSDVEVINKLAIPFNTFFPDVTLSRNVQTKNSNYEYYRNAPNFVQHLSKDSPDFSKGKLRFWDKYNKRYYYANDESQLEEQILSYIGRINDRKAEELSTLANTIESAINGGANAANLSADGSATKDVFLEKHFKQYIDQKWLFRKNTELNNLGIFIFEKEGVTEIVSITNNELNSKLKLAKGTSILGNFTSDKVIDPKRIMEATNGNLDLIKVLTYINEYPELFQGTKIGKIKSLNIWTKQGIEDYNETLLENFTELCRYAKVKCNITEDTFLNTLESVLFTVNDLMREEEISKYMNWTVGPDVDTIEAKREWLISRINALRKKYSKLYNEKPNPNDPIWTSYSLLLKGLNQLNGYRYFIESDPTNWIGFKGGVSLGINVTSINNADSKNIQEIARMIALHEEKIRKAELQWNKKIQGVFERFYKYHHQIKAYGNEIAFYDDLFETDPNGKISKDFKLKNPNMLVGADKELVETFLEIVNEIKFKGNKERIEDAKNSGEYYQVPLKIGSFKSQMRQGGFFRAIGHTYNEATNFRELFNEQESSKTEFERDNLQVYNKYNIDQTTREKILSEEGVQSMETNLETVLRSFIHSNVVEQMSTEFLPLIQGFKIGLLCQEFLYGQKIDNLLEFIKKYTQLNVYNEPIMDEGLRPAYKFMSMLKQVATASTLGLNLKSGTRETLQGIWIGLSRTAAGLYGKDQFTMKDFTKAMTTVLKEAPKSIGKVTLLEYMNWQYGMANADAEQLYREMSRSKMGIANFDSSQLYMFSRAPDMLHRMTILVAKMMHDGCFDAHSVIDDELVYDFKKDKRFNLLNDSLANKNSEEYKKQRALYTTMLEQFNREGNNLKDGDPLPKAYTAREAASVKSFADMCFGHYDKNTQMLAKHMFLGSFFLQFRTFISAKLEQWILKPGVYDQGSFKVIKDENGNEFVRKITFDSNGQPIVTLDTKNNLKEGDTWEYHVEWQGKPQEGILWSLVSTAKAIASLDQKQLNELWQDDLKRANLFLFLHDVALMMLLALLVKALFSWDDLKEEPWIKRWTASALYGSFQDGPIQNIIGGMVGDLNPPAYSILKNMVSTTGEVLTGDRSLWDATTNNVGALRELNNVSSMF